MSKAQTENSFFMDKCFLRLHNLPDRKKITILDMYGAEGKIWSRIKNMTKKEITVLRIEKERKEGKIYLKGDNLKFINTLSLENFDVIDIDAYGIPFMQLEIIFEKMKKTSRKVVVFVTIIQSQYGGLQKKLLEKIGYTRKMINKCPTLFYKNGFDKIKEYLAVNGIKRIKHRSSGNKHYICFKINENYH